MRQHHIATGLAVPLLAVCGGETVGNSGSFSASTSFTTSAGDTATSGDDTGASATGGGGSTSGAGPDSGGSTSTAADGSSGSTHATSGVVDEGSSAGSTTGSTGRASVGESESDSSGGPPGETSSDGGGSTSNANSGGSSGGMTQMGCEKVDFLFVIDNSGSMSEEQQNLINSFPGFIDAIQNTLAASDYHIMVVDTDAGGGGGMCSTFCMPDCCPAYCPNNPTCTCNGNPCMAVADDCDVTLGAGKNDDQDGADCGIAGGIRWMTEAQPNLSQTFACVGLVGTSGAGNEKPMAAMQEAVGQMLLAPGECNEGFLRDDALLVVTFITDEEDNAQKSGGTPADWKQAMLAAKGGMEDYIVMIGLVGDTALPNALCTADLADDSPNLRQFVDSWQYGEWASVCLPDYAPFFDDVVATIDLACDEIMPQ